MKEWLQKLIDRLRGLSGTQSQTGVPDETAAAMRKLANMLANTQDSECDCDTAYALMDEYIERKLRGEDVRSLMPQVTAHFQKCGTCRAELEALERVLAQEVA